MHVVESVEHLREQETADVLSHRAHRLAEVEEQAIRHVLHMNVHKIIDVPARWLQDVPRVSVADHLDDVRVVHVPQDGDLVVHRLDRVIVSAQKLFFVDFKCCFLSVLRVDGHVNFGGVALAERLYDIILLVENRVLSALSPSLAEITCARVVHVSFLQLCL